MINMAIPATAGRKYASVVDGVTVGCAVAAAAGSSTTNELVATEP